jgi:hypothetical protein
LLRAPHLALPYWEWVAKVIVTHAGKPCALIGKARAVAQPINGVASFTLSQQRIVHYLFFTTRY